MKLSKKALMVCTMVTVITVTMLGISTVQAQIRTAIISGTVTDTSGGIIPGVSISVRNVETGIARTAVTDDSGRYVVPLLDPGSYEIQAELVGFKTEVRSGITLEVGRSALVDFTLSVGEISERVVVEGEAPLVQTADSTISGLVDSKKIRDLPLNGRSYVQLALLQPGVTVIRSTLNTALSGRGTKFSVAGSRPGSNNFVLDGVTINDGSNQTPGSAGDQNLGVESIREFKVLTNTYSAAYGRNTGAVVIVVTKSGTNQWHGSVFEFHRNSELDAKNFFDPLDEDIPSFKRNQFGATLGGPLKKDKTFFFFNYEGLREGLGLSNIAIVPNALSREGILPDPNNPGGTRTVQVADSVKPFLDFFPIPNGRDFGDATGEFISSPNRITNEDFVTARFDHQFNDRNSIFVRYTFDEGEQFTPDELLAFETVFRNTNQSAVVEYKTIISPTLINTARFGFNRALLTSDSSPINGSGPPTLIAGRPFGKIRFGQAQSGPAPIATLGTANPELFPYTTQTYSDDINWTTGDHMIQSGLSITRIQNNNVVSGTGVYGNFLFNNVEDFITARPFQFSADSADSNRHRGWRQTLIGLYVQDNFRLSPRLTLNLGFRLEFLTEISETAGRTSQLLNKSDPEFTVGAPLFDQTSPQFQPRIGFAYDPIGDGKTVVRAGFGIFHDQPVAFWYALAGSNLLPFTSTDTLRGVGNVPFPDAFDALAGGLPTAITLDPEPDAPTKLHYNLNIERQIGTDTVVSIAYVGSRGTHLPRAGDALGPIPEIRPDGSKFFSRPFLPRRNPSFGFNLDTTNDGNAFYNALQVGVTRRFNKSLQYQFSYTYSHSIDDGSQMLGSEAQNAPQNVTQHDNRKADRSASTFDVRNNFVANATWDLPFGTGQRWGSSHTGVASKLISGWQLNSIVTLANGTPQTLLIGFNNSNNGDFLLPERPDLVSGRDNNPTLGGPDQFFDPTAFVLPEPGTFGDLARTTIIGPGFASVDVAVTKNTQILSGDRPVDIQFRAEFFNLFNRANFDLPDPTLFDASRQRRGAAGRITRTTTTSRQIQFGVKILF